MKRNLNLLGAAFFCSVFAGVRAQTDEFRLPNVVYILADDLGFGDLGCYGQTRFETPNIDQLAREGMRFTQHYSGSTVCAPSRCALLTGFHTGHASVRGNIVLGQDQDAPLPTNTFTLAHLFKKAEYATGIFGKWGLGGRDTGSEPLDMGFDRFYGYVGQGLAHIYYPYFLWNDRRRDMLWKNFGMERGVYAPDLIQREALRFIDTNKDRPFFCYYPMILPHAEMFAPEEYMEKYRGKYLPESSYAGMDGGPGFRQFKYGSQPEAHAAFAAMMNVIDDYVGELVSKINELGLARDTLIIFTSDNGPHREAGHDPDYFNSNGSLRGIKRDLYEGGIRVPMIARWPGRIKAGSQTDHLSAFWDVLPTIAELTEQTAPEQLDGISFLPTLLSDPESQEQHSLLYWEFHSRFFGGRFAIRQGDWKAVRYNGRGNTNNVLELYDLSTDPKETTDVAAQYPEKVIELNRLLEESRTTSPIPEFNSELNLKKEGK